MEVVASEVVEEPPAQKRTKRGSRASLPPAIKPPVPDSQSARMHSWRVDLLAAAAYLTPIPAILLLVLETRNDYVRIHAYHSLLLALPLAILHFVFLWSSFLQWILVLVDIGVYGWMA